MLDAGCSILVKIKRTEYRGQRFLISDFRFLRQAQNGLWILDSERGQGDGNGGLLWKGKIF
jgi:hypothetical protein